MTNVKRPFHLQLRPVATGPAAGAGSPFQLGASTPGGHRTQQATPPQMPVSGAGNPKQALSPTSAGSLPSQILPHLFVGAQEQTNRETLNRLNIKYILSLGMLPLVLQQHQHQQQPVAGTPTMPSRNCSKDFKIRVRSNTPSSTPTPPPPANGSPPTPVAALVQLAGTNQTNEQQQQQQQQPLDGTDNENKGVKQVRSVYCKCINIADNSDQLLTKFFDEAYMFIEEARRKKCNILVHCLAGISRSPTIAIAYLMRVKALHWREAYELVKQCRPQIDPNLNFMGQLRSYNRTIVADQLLSADNKTTTNNSPTNQDSADKIERLPRNINALQLEMS